MPRKKKNIHKNIEDLFREIESQRQPAHVDASEAAAAAPSAPAPRPGAISPDTIPLQQAAVRHQGDQAIITAPIRLGQNQWGELQVIEDRSTWDEDERLLIEQVADQLSLALQNARLLQETRQRAEDLELINRIAAIASNYSDIQETLTNIARELVEAFGFAQVGFSVLESNQRAFSTISIYPVPEDKTLLQNQLPLHLPLIQQILHTRQTMVLTNLQERDLPPAIAKVVERTQSHTLLIMPIISSDQVIALSGLHISDSQRVLDHRETQILQTIYSQIAGAIENARLLRNIRESEARFRDVALASADWVWEMDAQGNYTYCSDRVRDVLGYTPEEIIGKRPGDFMPAEDRSQILNAMMQFVRSRARIVQLEMRHLTKSGEIVILEADAVPILDEHNHLLGYRGVYKNITERKTAEKLQSAIYQITDAALSTNSLDELLQKIHHSIQEVLPAKNFYIALYDSERDLLRFPYFVDEKEKEIPQELPLGNGLTGLIIRQGKSLLVRDGDFDQLRAQGVDIRGVQAIDWLGVPLHTKEATIGAMAIQTYDPEIRITPRHEEILRLLATQVASALERFQAAEALARSEAELRTLFASMEDVILVVGRDTTYLRIAPTNPNGLYRPPEELIGRRMVDIFEEPLRSLFKNTVDAAFATGETQRIEYPLQIGEHLIWFDASISKLNEEELFWIARDITDRKRAEENLRRRNEYLATAAEVGRLITSTLDLNTLFRRTVNLIQERFEYDHVMVFTLNESGLEAILREATGGKGQAMKERHFSRPVGSQTLVGQVTDQGETIILNTPQEIEALQYPMGFQKPQSVAGLPLKIGERIIGALVLQSEKPNAFHEDDIAVLQILADQIAIAIDNARSYELAQQAVREMREVDRLKSQFLANMSHELRTPLNSIIGFSRVILKGIDGPLTELQKQDLTSIYNSGQHLLGLINDILDLSRIEAGKMELHFEEVDIKALIESVMSTARGLVKDRPVQLIQRLPDDLPTVRADQMRIRQVLLNLVSNAAKFTEEGSITVAAETIFDEQGRRLVRISVIDTGPGISEEDQKKLFQPFSQVDASLTRKVGGSGLGLSISQALVHMHEGEIGLESEVGVGSTFHFSIPTWEQPQPQPPAGGAEADAVRDEGRLLLAIDDDLNVIQLYERYLQGEGWRLVALTDPAQAVEKARQLKPQAITLDIMMPGHSGWDVLQALKSDPETRDIPILVCSIVEDSERGFRLGAADYLVKPILPEDLRQALERLSQQQGRSLRRILIIDDNPDDLRLMDKLLGQEGGFQTILADDGPSGLQALEDNPPDAILLDLFMPEMDGFAVLEALQANPQWRSIPVLLLTGGDLTPQQRQKLDEFGLQLLQKNSLSREEILQHLQKELKRVTNG